MPLGKVLGILGDLLQSFERTASRLEFGHPLLYPLVLQTLHQHEGAVVLDGFNTLLLGEGFGQVENASRHIENDPIELGARVGRPALSRPKDSGEPPPP